MQGAAHFSLTRYKYKMVYDINQGKGEKNDGLWTYLDSKPKYAFLRAADYWLIFMKDVKSVEWDTDDADATDNHRFNLLNINNLYVVIHSICVISVPYCEF